MQVHIASPPIEPLSPGRVHCRSDAKEEVGDPRQDRGRLRRFAINPLASGGPPRGRAKTVPRVYVPLMHEIREPTRKEGRE